MRNCLTDIKFIQKTLRERDFYFSKKQGQNFLICPDIPQRMAALFNKRQAVLEIGPGFGALTYALCQTAGQVIAVEADRHLLPILQENLGGTLNLRVIEGDALKLDLAPLFPKALSHAVCANLPYSITTPLIARLLELEQVDPLVVMVQKEVAARICAEPNTPEYGAFTLFCRMYAGCELLFDVGPENFMPQPKVQSVVIQFSRYKTPPVPQNLFKMTNRLVRAAFIQRRKTLANAISAGLDRNKEDTENLLLKVGIDPKRRGETLALQDYVTLAEVFAGC